MNALYNRLLIVSDVEKRLTSHVGSREHWMKQSLNLENEQGLRDVCGIRALIKSADINICGIEKGRHTNKGETKLYNIELLKKHFQIENVEEMDELDTDE